MARVSIGMPVFNGEQFLKAAMNSLLNQTYPDFELIISDNGSTDRTEEICRGYAKSDPRISYHRHDRNRGAAWNYNRVFQLCQGKYFKWAAHDDICAPTFLEKCVKVLDQVPMAVLSYPKTIIIDEHGKHIKKGIDNLCLRSPIASRRFRSYHQRLGYFHECNGIFGLIRADILRNTPLIGNYVSSDTILLGELALRGAFYEVPEYLFFRRDHSQASVRANPDFTKRAVWFDTENKDKILLPRWRWFYEYLRSIMRVKLRLHERVSCFIEMGKWFRRHGKGLIMELKMAGKQLLSTRT